MYSFSAAAASAPDWLLLTIRVPADATDEINKVKIIINFFIFPPMKIIIFSNI